MEPSGRFAPTPAEAESGPSLDAAEDEREENSGIMAPDEAPPPGEMRDQDDLQRRRRRRGRRGGRRRRRGGDRPQNGETSAVAQSPAGQGEQPFDRPTGGWSDESPGSPSWPETGGPSEPADEPASPHDDAAPYASRPEDADQAQDVIDTEPAEPPHAIEPVAPADSNGNGSASTVAPPEPADQPPPGPPKRGWWKRLIE